MNLADALLSPDEYDGATILESWRAVTGDEFEVLHVSVFGNFFLLDRAERVWLLDSWTGDLHGVSPSYTEYREKLRVDADFFDSWFLTPLIAQLKSSGMVRLKGHIFGPFVSPGLGGSLLPGNFSIAPLTAYVALSALEAQTIQRPQ
jgi:hypothetical protein